MWGQKTETKHVAFVGIWLNTEKQHEPMNFEAPISSRILSLPTPVELVDSQQRWNKYSACDFLWLIYEQLYECSQVNLHAATSFTTKLLGFNQKVRPIVGKCKSS